MVPVARRNLLAEKGRFSVSIGGVAVAILLILIVVALYRGFSRAGETIAALPGDVWVVQEGTVDPFHSVSVISEPRLENLRSLPGVVAVTPVLARRMTFEAPSGSESAYLMALAGEPPAQADRSGLADFFPQPGEVSIDEILAKKTGLRVGDEVVVGQLTVHVGRIRSGGGPFVQFAFLSFADARSAFGVAGLVNYAVLTLAQPEKAEGVSVGVAAANPGLVGFTREEFANSVRKEIDETFLPIIGILTVIGFVVGAAVVGLTIYTATIEHWRDFGVLKAMGASGAYLYRIVFVQATLVTFAGFVVGTLAAWGVAALARTAVPDFATDFRLADLGAVFGATAAMALVSSFIPVRRITGIPPASVFRA